MKPLYVLGCRLDPIGGEEAASRILTLAQTGAGAQVVTLGTEMVVYARRDARFRRIVNDCALSLCDTVGLLAAARWRGAPLRERIAGVELVERLCAGAATDGIPVYFLGGKDGVAADAAANLVRRFPGLRVAGTQSGFFTGEESAGIVGAIAGSGAKLLLVALGSPRQEYWLAEHLCDARCGAGIGVGGSFDVIAGRVARAPALVRRLHCEWLYRLISEPRRWRRQLALPLFVWLVVLDAFARRTPRRSAAES